jgi:phage-related tail fiber protein
MPNAIWGADLKSQKIVQLAPGSATTDAATYGQLLDAIRGLDVKDPVRVTTTTNITLSGTQTIDGVAVVGGDRVLVKNQTTQSQNGVYVVSAGAWSRATDADDGTEVTNGFSVAVLEGTNKGTGSAIGTPVQYVLTNTGAITIGATALNFSMVGAGGGGTVYSPGTGVLISGGTISIDPAYAGLIGRYNADLAAQTAGTPTVITHNLNSRDITVRVYEISSGIEQEGVVTITGLNTVSVTFPAAINAAQYRVVIKL